MHTYFLPAWSIGPNVYEEIFEIVKPFGRKAAVIGGKTALSVAVPELKKALAGTEMQLSEPIWFGGEASYENAAILEELDAVKNADMIFAVGGGRAIDTCKCAAGHLNKPIFTFPTLASNCAACTTLAVMYYPDGSARDLYYPRRCPIHTFINTTIVANSPAEYMWAGIGDSLAKEYESEFASRQDMKDFSIQHAPLVGTAVATRCTTPFLRFGKKAMEDIRAHHDSYEMRQVTLAIVITAGLVSNLTVDTADAVEEYFYNDSMAHVFYYGCTICPGAHKHLHGELVALGILIQLTLDGKLEVRNALYPFYHELALPMTSASVDFSEKDIPLMLSKAVTMRQWQNVPYPITEEMYTAAILENDRAAKVWLSENV